jgi:endonuclease YncB( thermonuclease family)
MKFRTLVFFWTLVASGFVPVVANSQEITGPIRVYDGGAIEITRQYLHLFGLTGLYAHQTCDADGVPWDCGVAALGWTADVTSGNRYRCTYQTLPGDTRQWATCMEVDPEGGAPIGEWDSLNQQWVQSGWAIANTEQTDLYTDDQQAAQTAGAGVWRLGGPPAIPAPTETVSGSAFVVDGNTLDIGGVLIKLYGSDAPELRQFCVVQSRFECGYSAQAHLAELVRGNEVHCVLDAGPRNFGHCRIEGLGDGPTLAEQMIADGWAVSARQVSQDFSDVELEARREKRGMWVSTFVRPAQWRTGQR